MHISEFVLTSEIRTLEFSESSDGCFHLSAVIPVGKDSGNNKFLADENYVVFLILD